MKLIVGLGNPGKKYERTRHNVGASVLAALYRRNQKPAEEPERKFGARYWNATIGTRKVTLLAPGDDTYMNEMGGPVQEAAHFWKIRPDEILIVYDDKELPLGEIRIRKGGSAGGHNGMKSVIQMLGTEDVPRLRIGVGTDASKKADAAKFVLGKLTKEESAIMAKVADRACDAIELMAAEGIDAAMNLYNKKG